MNIARALTAILVAVACGCAQREVSAGKGAASDRDPTAVIIAKYMYDPDSSAKVIVEPAAVRELQELLVGNPHAVEHACGYHWLIIFRMADGNVDIYAHNEECEEYTRQNGRVHAALKKYFGAIRERPTDFLYNVDVPVAVPPEALMSATRPSGMLMFSLDQTDERVPRIALEIVRRSPIPEKRAEWDPAVEENRRKAVEEMTQILERLVRENPGSHAGKVETWGSSFGRGRIEDTVRATFYCPFGADASRVRVPPEAHVLETTTPTTYRMQATSSSRSAADVAKSLSALLGRDVAVSAYPSARP